MKLLRNVAFRFDHSFGLDRILMEFGCIGHTEESRQEILDDARRIYDAIIGTSTIMPSNDVYPIGYVIFEKSDKMLLTMARAYCGFKDDGASHFDDLPLERNPGWSSSRREQILIDMGRFCEEIEYHGFEEFTQQEFDRCCGQ